MALKVLREVDRELTAAGFFLARFGKHAIYQHPCGKQISVALSPRDAGTQLKSVRSDIKRALREIGARA